MSLNSRLGGEFISLNASFEGNMKWTNSVQGGCVLTITMEEILNTDYGLYSHQSAQNGKNLDYSLTSDSGTHRSQDVTALPE